MNYEIKKIAWIDCVFAPLHETNSVTIQIMAKAGSIYETKDTNGISHFLEHMFFKWWKKYKTPAAVASVVDAFGWEFNAYTSDDHAAYYVKCAPEFTHQAIDVLADMMVHSTFPTDELEREKWVVIQEINMYQDNPQKLVSEQRQRRMMGDNSYGRSTLWPKENIEKFTQDHLFHHKETLYTKDNLIIIVAGKVTNRADVEDQLGELFAQLPEKKSQPKPTYTRHLPDQQQSHFDKQTEQNHLIISAYWYNGHDDNKYAAKLLTTILGGNMSSRLFQEIREKQWLCYYIGWSHYADLDEWLFYFRAGMDKERFDFGLEKIMNKCSSLSKARSRKMSLIKQYDISPGSLQMG